MITSRSILLYICLLVASINTVIGQVQHPNVVFVMTDDQGYGDIGAHGNEVIKTPNLDKLHHESLRLTNFHAGTTCAPSRSGLMTGVEGHRAGVWHTVGGCNILREKFIAMPQVFKNNGYATGIFGKWHLGDAYPYLPEDRGFEEVVSHGAGGIGQTPDYWDNDYFDDTYMHNGKAQKYKGYCTDVFFKEALNYIEKKKDNPFFVYISLNAPHGPLYVPEEYYNLYKSETRITEEQKAYYGMISSIDYNMGLLQEKLEELGLNDNTIVVFTTDNGTAAGYKVIKGVEYGYNANMQGLKSSPYEGGHRVPFFIKYNPKGWTSGVDINKLIMNYDILPTFVELCNLKKPSESKYTGRSIVPLLDRDNNAKWSKRYAVVDKNKQQRPEKWLNCSVMDENWRLVKGKELYDITTDPGQHNDISSKHPDRVKAMRDHYEEWWADVSRDFDHFEAYKIGAKGKEETAFTIHDLHTDQLLPYAQRYIRDPFSGKKPTLTPPAYWMVDVETEGEYEIALSRWPRESKLRFKDTVKEMGPAKPWYVSRAAGIQLNIEKASIEVKGNKLEKDVNPKSKEVRFVTNLTKGRQKFKASFVDSKEYEFGAFYIYIKKLDNK